MTKTILVPLDGSQLGEAALPWATRLAQQLRLSITLVRVLPWPEFPTSEFGGYISADTYNKILETDRAVANEYLAGKQVELGSTGLPVATIVREGPAAEAIHDVADELGAYAVVMASHGRGGVKRLVLGSVAERLLEQATIPILLIRDVEATRAASFHRILVPLDGSVLAERAIDQARGLLADDGVLILQRVVEPIYDAAGGGDVITFVIDEDATKQAEIEARAYLDRSATNLISRGYRVSTRLHRGRPAAEIVSSTNGANPDLIVMTTHGRTGPARWVMGSVADEVSRGSDRPVFLVSVRAVVSQVTGDFTVRDLMTPNPETMNEHEMVISAARKMLRRRISGAPVVDVNGKLVGVLSEYDLLAWHDRALKELARNDADLDPGSYGRLIETETIASLLTRPAISVDQDADMMSALRLMLNRKLRRLPVTDGGQLVGIVSRADIVRAMAQHWSSVHEANEAPFEVISL